MSEKKKTVTPITCLLMAFFSIIVFMGILYLLAMQGKDKNSTDENQLAFMTVIPAPTITQTSVVSEPEPTLEIRFVSTEGFSIGTYVQVTNTEGTGLSVREGAGTTYNTLFVAKDGDLFQIVDGPDDRSGYVWWKLQSVENEDLTGWAAASYLVVSSNSENQNK